jgi:hypothetical protein
MRKEDAKASIRLAVKKELRGKVNINELKMYYRNYWIRQKVSMLSGGLR